jgi:hypothetical protein
MCSDVNNTMVLPLQCSLPCSAEFQPIMFINGLADVLASKYKVKIYEGSRVLFKDMTLDGVVPAESGGRIKARDGVVLATNSPINHNGRRLA